MYIARPKFQSHIESSIDPHDNSEVSSRWEVLDSAALPPGNGLAGARVTLLLKLPVRVGRAGRLLGEVGMAIATMHYRGDKRQLVKGVAS